MPLLLALVIAGLVVSACGDSPLESVGRRSSAWINEPTVPTTAAVETPPVTLVGVERMLWANDEFQPEDPEKVNAVLAEVFSRRAGDRFIQAGRAEIAVALPDVAFPAIAPSGAEWVSSQLVFDNDGNVATDPAAAFGVWSAEPYTRSRSVAQLAVLKVSIDEEGAQEVASGEEAPSCGRFAERTTDGCEILSVDGRDTWHLRAAGGSTLIWFDTRYRYELFGRSFVPVSVLEDMSARTVPLASIGAVGS